MRTGYIIAAAIVGIALFFWIKTSVGRTDENLPPRYGGSFGPVQILELVY